MPKPKLRKSLTRQRFEVSNAVRTCLELGHWYSFEDPAVVRTVLAGAFSVEICLKDAVFIVDHHGQMVPFARRAFFGRAESEICPFRGSIIVAGADDDLAV